MPELGSRSVADTSRLVGTNANAKRDREPRHRFRDAPRTGARAHRGDEGDEDQLKRDRDAGVVRVVVSLESDKADKILPELDRWAKIIPKVA